MPTELAATSGPRDHALAASDFVPARRRFTGRHALVWAFFFFGITIGMNVLMMTLAVTTMPGTVVDSAYKAGQAYNGNIAAARAQEARHWQVDTHVERSPEGIAIIKVMARDAAGNPLNALKAQALFQRPTDRRADVRVELSASGAGTWRGNGLDVLAGAWDVVLSLENNAGERIFQSKNRVVLP
jgi:nitrogen fixation protein FixH